MPLEGQHDTLLPRLASVALVVDQGPTNSLLSTFIRCCLLDFTQRGIGEALRERLGQHLVKSLQVTPTNTALA